MRPQMAPRDGGRDLVPGLLLLLVGGGLLLITFGGAGGEVLPALVGAAFLVAYAVRRHYGLLVAGGVVTGLGLGVVMERWFPAQGALVVLGLGTGFLVIYAVDLAVARAVARWWPLVPGAILCLVGLLTAAQLNPVLGQASRWWPALLVVAGLWLLLSRVGRRAGR